MLGSKRGARGPRTYIVVVVGLSLLVLESASLAVGTVLGDLGLVQDLALDLLNGAANLVGSVWMLKRAKVESAPRSRRGRWEALEGRLKPTFL